VVRPSSQSRPSTQAQCTPRELKCSADDQKCLAEVRRLPRCPN
jgi:hypothetical protein